MLQWEIKFLTNSITFQCVRRCRKFAARKRRMLRVCTRPTFLPFSLKKNRRILNEWAILATSMEASKNSVIRKLKRENSRRYFLWLVLTTSIYCYWCALILVRSNEVNHNEIINVLLIKQLWIVLVFCIYMRRLYATNVFNYYIKRMCFICKQYWDH